jgi:hypothetical protein
MKLIHRYLGIDQIDETCFPLKVFALEGAHISMYLLSGGHVIIGARNSRPLQLTKSQGLFSPSQNEHPINDCHQPHQS